MAIDASTQVVVSMGTLLVTGAILIAAAAGAFWAVLHFTIGSMRDDLHDIRSSIREMNAVNTRLTDQISLLRTDYVVVSGRMENLELSLDFLREYFQLPRPFRP